jgi:hypothetical protein
MKPVFGIRKPSDKAIVIAIILLCFISRIPQLISVNRILDGDECVLAIMGKHLYRNGDFQLFFIGQQYGLSIFESLAMVPFIATLGMTTVSIKLAMLCLWTIGIVFFYKALVAVNTKNAWLPVSIILIFIFTPAWAVWSMKARGGYLTAFLFNSVALYLLFNEKLNRRPATYIWLGIILAIICESQSLWLLGILPLYFYRLLKDRSIKHFMLLVLPASALLIASYFYKQQLPSFYTRPDLYFAPRELWDWVVTRVTDYLYVSLHGHYFFHQLLEPAVICGIAAWTFSKLVFLLLIAGIISLFLKKRDWLFISATLGIFLALVSTMFSYFIEPRYLLPITGIALFSLTILLNRFTLRKWMYIPMAAFTAIGIPCMIAFYNFTFGDIREAEIRSTLNTLQNEGIDYVFCPHDFVTWQVNFYSDERIMARAVYMPGRYPAYNAGVNRALLEHKKTAVFNIATDNPEYKLQFDSVKMVGNYYVCVYPRYEVLKRKFQF